MANDNTLVFTIAMNGYQWLYRRHIQSQRRYALRHGYDYVAVSRPGVTRLGVECCWLKILLLKHALMAGYQRVLFVDADAYINPNAPALDVITHDRPDASVFMAKGYSGQFNSGVVLVTHCEASLAFLHDVMHANPPENAFQGKVGWGENDQVIACSQGQTCIAILDPRWNNTFDIRLQDFIRHYNHGPLRTSLPLRLIHKSLSRLSRLLAKLDPLPHQHQLAALFRQVQRQYPHFY